MKRTKRFGMPVSLSEEEKCNSRVERYPFLYPPTSLFGTTSAVDGLDSSKQSEDLKRKATVSYSRSMDDEYEKLIKRMNPPRVVDSANKHGILLEVVTNLNLVVTKAYICSDGGWFMDEKEADPDCKLSFAKDTL
ncbi:ACT domain [Orobanche hederae]